MTQPQTDAIVRIDRSRASVRVKLPDGSGFVVVFESEGGMSLATVREDSIWMVHRAQMYFLFGKKTDMIPNKKEGPGLLQNQSIRRASFWLMLPLSYA